MHCIKAADRIRRARESDVHLLCTHKPMAFLSQVEPGDHIGFAEALERFAIKTESRSGTIIMQTRRM